MGCLQTETLICYMEQHCLFARGQIPKLGPQGHIKYKKMWNSLADILNRIGPSQKDVTAWQKCWTTLRLNAKTKKAKFLKSLSKTGHDTPDADLNPRDDRVTQIYGKYGTGMNLGRELGFKQLQVVQYHESQDDFDSLLFFDPIRLLDVIPSRINNFSLELHHYQINDARTMSGQPPLDPPGQPINVPRVHQKPTDRQINCLIDYMERHSDLVNGLESNPEQCWKVLITLLHSHTGAKKSVKAWQKTWSGLITAARQSMRFLVDGRKNTPMSPHHIRIIDIVGYREESNFCSSSAYQDMMEEPCLSQPNNYNLASASSNAFGQTPRSSVTLNGYGSTSSMCYTNKLSTSKCTPQMYPANQLQMPSTSRCMPEGFPANRLEIPTTNFSPMPLSTTPSGLQQTQKKVRKFTHPTNQASTSSLYLPNPSASERVNRVNRNTAMSWSAASIHQLQLPPRHLCQLHQWQWINQPNF